MRNSLKEKLARGKSCLGIFIAVGSTETIEIAGITNYDFVVLDMEHGHVDTKGLLPMIIAAERRNITAMVRIPEINSSTIVNILDLGAAGIQVPQVGSADDARNAVSGSKYYPEGTRGMGSPRAGDYGATELKDYIREANKNTIVAVQCESREGYENIEEIAGIPGVDVIFLGPYDMSQSLGIPGDIHSPEIDEIREEILTVCKKYGKIPGTFAADGKEAKKLKDMGFRYITMGMDVDHIYSKFSEEIRAFSGTDNLSEY